MGIRIEEIKYTQPSLSDVFLHYTGREIRDEEADWRESVRMRHRVR
jgi:ABC-2 type transport system ATP-binding protein